MSLKARLGRSSLWHLFLMRVRWFRREPSALFWVFLFPLLASVVLGTAFRDSATSELTVGVVEGPDAAAVAAVLDGVDGLSAQVTTEQHARELLRRGRLAAVLIPGPAPRLLVDPTHAESRTARQLTLEALERHAGRTDLLGVQQETLSAPGSRYIDFLIPGLLAYGLMAASVFGIGFPIVEGRRARLLKRLVATPMPRSHYLLSFVLARFVLAFVEVLFFIGYSRLLFDVRIAGAVLDVFVLGLLGSLSFAGIGLMIVCRSQNSDAAQGVMNLATSAMLVLSGVFFAASRFPAWTQPVLQLLPLTALVDALRAVMLEGVGLSVVWKELAILAAWGSGSFLIALRLFRWR